MIITIFFLTPLQHVAHTSFHPTPDTELFRQAVELFLDEGLAYMRYGDNENERDLTIDTATDAPCTAHQIRPRPYIPHESDMVSGSKRRH